MFEGILQLAYPVQALLATLLTWGITSLGACLVFFMAKPNRNLMDGMLGVAGGVMVAASFFSLLAPSIEMSQALGLIPWLTALAGFLGGGLLLFLGDRFFTHHLESRFSAEGCPKSLKRSVMLVVSITLQLSWHSQSTYQNSLVWNQNEMLVFQVWVRILSNRITGYPSGMPLYQR